MEMIYDDFSSDYDYFVNWSERLKIELPFIVEQLKAINAHNVLDAACGTGMHAIALAKLGFNASGADLSKKMVGRAQLNANSAGVNVQFKTAAFGELSQQFGKKTFDALLCLGNSLPHLLIPAELTAALQDFADCLKPGGILILQNRNFDAVLQNRERWMEPQSACEGNSEWLFLRFYDFEPDGLLAFNILTLTRTEGCGWKQSILSTPLRPILAHELKAALQAAGFQTIEFFGDMTGSPFKKDTSGNLIAKALGGIR